MTLSEKEITAHNTVHTVKANHAGKNLHAVHFPVSQLQFQGAGFLSAVHLWHQVSQSMQVSTQVCHPIPGWGEPSTSEMHAYNLERVVCFATVKPQRVGEGSNASEMWQSGNISETIHSSDIYTGLFIYLFMEGL